MYRHQYKLLAMCADVVWLLALAALFSRGSGATNHHNETLLHGDQGDSPHTIRFYINKTITANYDIDQCLSERPIYYLRPHQKLTVMILMLNKDKIVPNDYSFCKWNDLKYKRNKSAGLKVTGYGRTVLVEIMDIGNKSGELYYWGSSYNPYRSCQVHIHLDEGVVDETQYTRYFVILTMILKWNASEQVVRDLSFIDNTWMTTYCEAVDANNNSLNKPIMTHRIYRNGTAYDIDSPLLERPRYNEIHTFYFNATNDIDYDDNEIACFFVNKSMYPTWKTGVRLKYYKEWWIAADNAEVNLDTSIVIILVISIPATFMIIIIGICWKYRERIAVKAYKNNRHDSNIYEDAPYAAVDVDTGPTNATNNESRSSTPNSIDYQEIYDVVYEGRQGLQRVRKIVNLSEDAPKPCPPPVETIPLRERVVPPPTAESLIPPSDRYLLYLDSEGYEIPDEARFITLPCTTNN